MKAPNPVAAAPVAASPIAAPANQVQVQIPDGLKEGDTFRVQAGDQAIDVQVPSGMTPGQTIMVSVPGSQAPVLTLAATSPESYAQPVYEAGAPTPALIRGGSASVAGLSIYDMGELPEGYSMLGTRYPIVTKELAPGACIKGEPGSMLTMDRDVKMKSGLMGKGLGGAFGSAMGGELFKNSYTNHGTETQVVSVAGNVAFGNVLGINLNALGGKFTAKPGKYFASDPDVKVTASILRAKNCTACCCGGMPPIVQRIQGSGYAFLQGGGAVMAKVLQPGESLVIDHRYIVGYSESMDIDVKQVGNCQTCCFGGEGCFNTKLTGPGTVYLESYGPERMVGVVAKYGASAQASGGIFSLIKIILGS